MFPMQKTKHLFRGALCALLAIAMTFAAVVPASANSAPRYWSGLTHSGALLTGNACPIEVKSEKLTLSIPDLPEPFAEDEADRAGYKSEMTAEYTFYNPTDETVAALLAFPCGAIPEYAEGSADGPTSEELGEYRARYGAFINGEAAETTVRYALNTGLEHFDVKEALPYQRGELKDDALLRPDTPVTTYVWRFDEIRKDEDGYTEAVLHIPGKTGRIVVLDKGGIPEWYRDTDKISFTAGNGAEITLTVFGDPLPEDAGWSFAGLGEASGEAPGKAEPISSESVGFMDFCLRAKEKYPDASDEDLFNATVDMVNTGNIYGYIDAGTIVHTALTPDLMCWFEYEITLAPGETLTNTVRAPLYPQIDDNVRPRVYNYTYLLSPAAEWAKFGALEIVIETPFILSNGSIDGFEKTETGYRFAGDGLPEGELTFDLCESKAPLPAPDNASYLLMALIGFAVAALPVILLIVVLLCVRRSKKKKSAARD